MRDTQTTTIDLIRHGEPVGGKKYRGQLDDPLSEKGWSQMRGAVGDHCPWQIIVTSTLCRCSAFAEELARRHTLPLEYDPRLMEIGFGAWEGRTATELMAEQPDVLMRFWSDPARYRPPGAEPLASFQERVAGAWKEILDRHAGQHLLLVGHAGVIRLVISRVLGMPVENMFRVQVANAGLTRIQVDESEGQRLPRLVFHGGSLA